MSDHESLYEVAEITNLPIGMIRQIAKSSEIDEELSEAISHYHSADQARYDYFSQETNSREELAAIMAWLGFITTIAEAKKLFFLCPSGSKSEKAVIKRMCEILQN